MQVGRPLFSQVMDFVPWTSFDRLVEKYGGDKNATRLRCAAQFRAMAFAQLTYRESLRDIEASLNAHPSKLYGMGFRILSLNRRLRMRTRCVTGACGMTLRSF